MILRDAAQVRVHPGMTVPLLRVESLECDGYQRLRDAIQIHACCALFDLAIANTNTYLSIRKEIRPKDNTPQRSHPWRMFYPLGPGFLPRPKNHRFSHDCCALTSTPVSDMRIVWLSNILSSTAAN
jgi:hypothetical protein